MKNHTEIFLLSLLLVFVLFLIHTPSCKGLPETRVFNLGMDISITQVNLENHTILANVDLDITGVPSIEIDGIQQTPETVYVYFDNIDHDEVNCTLIHNLGNGTYIYSGNLAGKYWYLHSFGQLYPFDFGYAEFKLYPYDLLLPINDTVYGPEPEWSYSFNVVRQQVVFSGSANENLKNTWKILPTLGGAQLQVKLERNETTPQFLIIIPLLWFLTLVAVLPLFLSRKEMKLQFLSSLLLFAPVFIFAIQSFIPPRNSLSIPEFLSFALVLASTVMIVFSLANYRNEKQKCYLDIGGLMLSLSFIYFLGIILYFGFLGFTDSGLAVSGILIYLTITFGASAIIRAKNYDRYEKTKKTEIEKRFEEYNPEDFDY